MSGEVLINLTPMETRVALVEHGVLQEAAIERHHRQGIVGNIYKGKVVRVLPGMQAAFIDIGLERAAFIHVKEVAAQQLHADQVPPIQTLLHEGQRLVVQVVKDPIGTKGARLTTHLSLPSRYLVYMPGATHLGVSQRIKDDALRERLRKTIEDLRAPWGELLAGGFIVRTAAEGADDEALALDMQFLAHLWRKLSERRIEQHAPSLLYYDQPLFLRVLRDLMRDDVERVRIDSRENFEKLKQFAEDYIPALSERIEHYSGDRPIFEMYSVEDELQKALERKVPLKSGGYLILDQTEAMTTIDVNTGGYVGYRNLEDTIFRTNLEAAQAIARQLRLRNLGGIIIIDFIDMASSEHQRQVIRTLEKALEHDLARTKLSGVTELGLVQVTRKRTRKSLEQTLCEPCHACHGRGTQKTAETLCYEILREIVRINRLNRASGYLVLASSAVVERFLNEAAPAVSELETFIGLPVRFQAESHYYQEQYDIVLG